MLRSVLKTVAWCCIALFLRCIPDVALGSGARISEDEARELVRQALKAHRIDGPKVELNRLKFNYAPDFYSFEATWDNPNGSPNLGSYAVNPWTGDVWQLVVCREITSPTIQRIQRSIRKRLHVTKEQYLKLHAKTPAC